MDPIEVSTSLSIRQNSKFTLEVRMKKLDSYKDFRVGGIYNKVYVGTNAAFAKLNREETFEVIRTEPHLQIEVLFDPFGSVFTEDLRSGLITFGPPKEAFAQYELFEPADKSEWFIKSVKAASLTEAIEAELIPREQIENREMRTSDFLPCWTVVGKFFGVHHSFSIKGIPSNPYLQRVSILWKTLDDVKAELGQYGSTVR